MNIDLNIFFTVLQSVYNDYISSIEAQTKAVKVIVKHRSLKVDGSTCEFDIAVLLLQIQAIGVHNHFSSSIHIDFLFSILFIVERTALL